MIGSLPSLRSSRNPLVFVGLLGVVIFAGYRAAQLVLAGDVDGLMFVPLIAAGGAVTVAILNDWRRGLYVLIGWILFEDFVRKYLGNNMAIYFGKDILTIILLVSFFRSRIARRIERFRIPFRVASGFGNLVVELGIVGLILWIVLGFSIAFSAWGVVVKLKGTPWFPMSFVIFLFSVLLFFPMTFVSFSAYQDFVINAYFWLLVGILFRLPALPKVVMNAQAEKATRQA